MPDLESIGDARATALALLDARRAGATICPSEVAKALAGTAAEGAPPTDWRSAMATVHVAVDALVAEGKVRLSWKGRALASRQGPYRIARISLE